MQLIIETDEEYAPMFRAVAKAVKAQVKIGNGQRPTRKVHTGVGKESFPDPSIVQPGEKPSDLFKGAWKKDSARTAQSIRESAWKRKN